ncbi:MAG: hypothetical protein L3J39_19255 [Verrucomicrobiales bacterium]|nr:hypothetical protein [Verrucomicrobiales bacterium]
MSLYEEQSRLLTIRPRIKKTGGITTVSNSFILRLLTLFLYLRNVRIDENYKLITIREKWFWLRAHETVVPFDAVSHIDYDYASSGTSWGLSFQNFEGYERHDSVERFMVKIVTHNNDKHDICAFRGEGAEMTGWSGVLLGGDKAYDFSGTQAEESQVFVSYLCELLNVPIGKPFDSSGLMVECKNCGRETSKAREKCLYCAQIQNP